MIEERKIKIEIGCGEKRPYRKDFVGLDRFALYCFDDYERDQVRRLLCKIITSIVFT